MDYIKIPEQEIEVVDEFDVVVAGGGPAGVSAAVSAARSGAKTALIERYGYLGGQATGGLVILLVGLTDGKSRIIKGFCEETIERLNKMSATKDVWRHVLFDPEAMKLTFDEMLQENGVKPFYHSFAADVIKENKVTKGIIIDGKSGKRFLQAKTIVDATGDADLAKFGGVAFDTEPLGSILPVTLSFRAGGVDIAKASESFSKLPKSFKGIMEKLGISSRIGGWVHTLNDGEAWFNLSNVENIDITNSDDLTKAEIQGRKQVFEIMETFKKDVSGFENAYIINTSEQIGVRESRRIKGLHRFERQDVGRTFEDVIAKAPDYTNAGRGGTGSVQVPYSCLISKDSENMIFAGRCISVAHEIIDMFREIPCCMATGQAAGIAAAISAKESVSVQKIDIKKLQAELKRQGALLD